MSDGLRLSADISGVDALLGSMVRRLERPEVLLTELAEIMLGSVRANFAAGGRPEKWQPLAPSTMRSRGAAGPILQVRGMAGGLLGSIRAEVGDRFATIGSDAPHAAIHQYGGIIRRQRTSTSGSPASGSMLRSKTPRAKQSVAASAPQHSGGSYTITIPARPFLVVQDADLAAMTGAVVAYLLGVPGSGESA